jgi:hypothetical protein
MDRAIEIVNNKITEMDTIINSLGDSYVTENFRIRKYILKDLMQELVSEKRKNKN